MTEIYNSVIDEVADILLQARDEIRANMASQNINASGRTSAGIQVERYEGGVRLVLTGNDVAPLYTLETGRGAGRVPTGFTEILEQWTRDKGLTFANEQERRSFAYLLGRKIARQGTQRNMLPADVYSEPVNAALAKMKGRLRATISEYVRYITIGVQPHIK